MKFIKDHYKTILAVLSIIGIVLYLFFNNTSYNSTIESLKKTILDKDSLIKIRDGEYTKLVNDTKTKKDLDKLVKDISEKTYQDIKKNGEKIVNNTGVSVKPINKVTTDTVYVDSSGVRRFTSYYPNKDSAFIIHQSTITNSLATNNWDFKPLKLNVVVTQQKDGMYRARLIGPKWIEAQEVTVSSLPMNKITQKDFKTLLGASGGYSFNDRNIVVGVYTGFKYKNKIILIHGETNKVVSLGYIQEF